jgi:hypothetical protein
MTPAQRLVQPLREPASAVDAAIDKVTAARREQEWQELVRLAEQVFPDTWDVRVQHFSNESYVTVKYQVARGVDPIAALKQAIAWYRQQHAKSRIVLPE